MKLLLDTHTLLWFLADDPRLSAKAKATIEDPVNERWLSGISLLEIAVKISINKLRLPVPFAAMFPAQLTLNHIHMLALEAHHAAWVVMLPLHHRDPFDRLLYGVNRVW